MSLFTCVVHSSTLSTTYAPKGKEAPRSSPGSDPGPQLQEPRTHSIRHMDRKAASAADAAAPSAQLLSGLQ